MADQVDLNATGEDELVPINDVARMLGIRTSALRYYDERGLVLSRARMKGRRWYGRAELRRLAFIKIAQQIGLSLDTVAAILDAPQDTWRSSARRQIDELDELVERARAARSFLVHSLECPTESPVRDCPSMIDALEHLVRGGSVEELGRQQYAADAGRTAGPG